MFITEMEGNKLSELIIKKVELKNLHYPKYNPRTMTDEEMQKLKTSINEFGYVEPIIINKHNNNIIGGNHRAKALQELGYKTADAIILDITDPNKEKTLNLALNRIVGGWDKELLTQVLKEINISPIDVKLTGFDNIEMEDINIELKNYNTLPNEEEHKPQNNPKNDELFYFSPEEIQEDIINGWQTYSTLEEYIKNIIDIPTAKYQFNRLCQGYNDGYNISLLFNPHRLSTKREYGNDIFNAINYDEEYKKGFSKVLTNVRGVLPPNQYYKHINYYVSDAKYINEFPPYLARDIYKHYCNDNSRILNQCAGWGGEIDRISKLYV